MGDEEPNRRSRALKVEFCFVLLLMAGTFLYGVWHGVRTLLGAN